MIVVDNKYYALNYNTGLSFFGIPTLNPETD